MLEELDRDRDGRLSLEEHLQDMQSAAEGGEYEDMTEFQDRRETDSAKFAAADEDGDGLLSLEELPFFFYPETHEGVLGVAVQELMRAKDRSQDGRLTPMEF